MKIRFILILSGLGLFLSVTSCVSDSKASSENEPERTITLDEIKAKQEVDTTKVEEKKEKKYIRPIEIAEKEEAEEEKAKAEEEVKEAKVKKVSKEASRKPVIAFEGKNWSFGKLTEGDKVEHKFFFTNTGKAPLVIKDASATCGCTYPSRPYVAIKPGEKSYIGVTFDSKGKSGQQKPTVTVVTNAGTHKLYMEGMVEAKTEEESN